MYYFMVADESPEPIVEAMDTETILRTLGISGKLLGFNYMIYIAEMMHENPRLKRVLTKVIYPETAKHFGVTTISVERAIRTAIQTCWRQSDHSVLNRMAKRKLERMPTNSEFLDIIVSNISPK